MPAASAVVFDGVVSAGGASVAGLVCSVVLVAGAVVVLPGSAAFSGIVAAPGFGWTGGVAMPSRDDGAKILASGERR